MNDSVQVFGIAAPATAWRWPLGIAACGLLALLGIYHDTWVSLVDIWWRSQTFAHGFLIFPISIWLIWRRRQLLAEIAPKPDYRAAPLLVLLGLGWLVSRYTNVLILEQYAFIGMIPTLVWMLLGWPVVRELAFPLGFLLLAVPAGESLVYPMMEFTADFTVGMLRLTGLPVFREGTFFSIPSGDWSVVEGCSGLRYLIASMTLGLLYAYLSYRSIFRRLAFMVLAVIFPVIANGFRAYLIVMIAHLSDMKLALGIDHFIYGWVFFGLVMMLLFWLGSYWAETQGGACAEVTRMAGNGTEADRRAFGSCVALALGISVLWPLHAARVEQLAEARTAPIRLALPDVAGSWRTTETAATDWEPSYVGQGFSTKRFYTDGTDTVGLYLRVYRDQGQGAELINSRNLLIPQKHPVWRMPEEKPVEIHLNGKAVSVLQGRLQSAREDLLTWRWNRIAKTHSSSDYLGKLLEAREKLFGTLGDEAAIILATPYRETPETAKRVLQRFVDAMLPLLERSLDLADENREG